MSGTSKLEVRFHTEKSTGKRAVMQIAILIDLAFSRQMRSKSNESYYISANF